MTIFTRQWDRLHRKAFDQRDSIEHTFYHLLDTRFAQWVNEQQSVVVIGFPRSGTTFLMEVLSSMINGRLSYEPLSDRIPEARQFLHPHVFDNPGKVKEKNMGFPYRRPNEEDAALKAYFTKVLKGNLDHPRVWHGSRKLKNYRSMTILTKIVWGNLMAAWIANTFGSKIIYIYRHPAGVIDSIIRQKWAGMFQDSAFMSLFMDQQSLVNDWLVSISR